MTGPQGAGVFAAAVNIPTDDGGLGGGPGAGVSVTINQHPDQDSATSIEPVLFLVEFSEAVTGFGTADVTLGGTAGATTVGVSGTGATYLVSVTGMTGPGTVTATIPAGIATASGGATNNASTSTDNSVDWEVSSFLYQAMLDLSPLGLWRFNPASGGIGNAGSLGSAADATASGTPVYRGFPAPDGRRYVDFNSAGGFEVPDNNAFEHNADSGGMTIIVVTNGHGGMYMGKRSGGSEWSWTLDTESGTGKPRGWLWTSAQFVYRGKNGTYDVFSDGTWHILVWRVSASTAVDAIPNELFGDTYTAMPTVNPSTGMSGSIVNSVSPLRIGMDSITAGTSYFHEGIAMAGFYAGFMSIANIKTVIDAGVLENWLVLDGPTVTIDKKSGQADPASSSPVTFRVTFSEDVDGFNVSDIILSGTAVPTTATVTAVTGTSAFDVAVEGMTANGTVIMTIPYAAARSVATTKLSQAPTIIDNSIAYANPILDLTAFKVGLGAAHFWPLETARAVNADEPDLIGSEPIEPNVGTWTTVSGPTPWGGAVKVNVVSGSSSSTGKALSVSGWAFPINASFTVGMWVKCSNLATTGGVLIGGTINTSTYWMALLRDPSGGTPKGKWQLDDASIGGASISPTGPNIDGSWRYVHIWRDYNATAASDIFGWAIDAGTAVTYARSAITGSGTPGATQASAQFCLFGWTGAANNGFQGDVNHVTFWPLVLSSGQRTTDYNKEVAGP